MRIVRKTDILIDLISLAVIVGTLLYFIGSPKENLLTKISLQSSAFYAPRPSTTQGAVYDFNSIIKAIDDFRIVEMAFHSNFEQFIQNPNSPRDLQIVIQKLKTEKNQYWQFLQKARFPMEKTLSSKKRNSLRYYLRVLESYLEEAEDMARKVNLYVEKTNFKE